MSAIVVGRNIAKYSGRVAGSLLILCVTTLGAGKSWASTFTFSGPDVSKSSPQTFTGSPSGSITVYAYECDNHFGSDTACLSGNSLANHVTVDSANLYEKNDGASELGAGVYDDPLGDNEISADTFLDLDMTSLGATSGTLTISSLQPGETFEFCYGNSNSTWNSNNCTGYYTGVTGNNMTVNFNLGAYHDISLIAGDNDVLLASLTTSARPRRNPARCPCSGPGWSHWLEWNGAVFWHSRGESRKCFC